VRLHPGEVLVSAVPAACCWHVSSSVAYPSQDGTPWCRLPHAVLCPARPAPQAASELAELRRMLAVNTRRLIDAGVFCRSTDLSPRPGTRERGQLRGRHRAGAGR
jgi:hypothetical protein